MLMADSHVVNCVQPHPTAYGNTFTKSYNVAIVIHISLSHSLSPPPSTHTHTHSVAVLATSGIDYDIKLWEPLSAEECSLGNLTEVGKINE